MDSLLQSHFFFDEGARTMLEQGTAAFDRTGFLPNQRGVWLSLVRHGLLYTRTLDGLPHEWARMWNRISLRKPI